MSTKSSLLLATLAAASLSVSSAQAQIVTLTDGNSSASVNFGSQAGMYAWNVNNVNQLNQQWFWYRIDGDPTGQHSIDTIGAPVVNSGVNQVTATYTDGSFSLALTYQLSGGLPGGQDGSSDITESITIRNITSSPLTFHFFQYSDFMLGGTQGGETASIFQNGGSFSQATVTKGGSKISETVDQPMANGAEADLATATRNHLNQGSPYNLNGNLNSGPDPSLDATWALQWDFTIAGNGSADVLKDKHLDVGPVPEPGVFSLLGLGLAAMVVRRNRLS
ncbi:MAG: hypothetical protein C5B50_16645 [Verrucomicrobia bacterium]|nr:MAG: hypothetical protein C5B50_16645 [Verrucomicrobiota bacterium]